MARGFDGLIEYLLEAIALCGDRGASSKDFTKFINEFYAHSDEGTQDDLWFEEDAPLVEPQVVDQPLLETVWKWLRVHPDIFIGNDKTNKQLDFAEFQAREVREGGNDDGTAPADTSAGTTTPQPPTEKAKGKSKATKGSSKAAPVTPSRPLRLYVNEDRMWQAVAGHGVDTKRIAPLEFELLSIIAAHGEEGMLQPDLIKISGQDKRSAPKRTDVLAEKGYIVKQSVSVRKMRTSHITLKKFKKEEKPATNVVGTVGTQLEGRPVFVEGKLIHENLLDYLADALEKNPLIIIEEMKMDLGIGWDRAGRMNKWARRTLMRAVQRLCALGVVKKVKARAREKEEIMQIRKKRTDRDVVPYVRCIRALRPITDRDRHLMVHPAVGIPQGPLGYENEEEEDWDNEDDEEDPGEEGLELDVNQDNLEAELLEDTGELEENGRLVPQWDPDVPLLDFVWNCVDASGPIGASSMNLREHGLGHFWRRPLDNTLGRLTDVWERSQPPHLRHLAIIRDTAYTPGNKYIHYIYRTYGNFEKAVNSGATSWEAVKGPETEAAKKKNSKSKKVVNKQELTLDQYGFPQLSKDTFEGGKGDFTLAQCRKAVVKKTSTLAAYRGLSDRVVNGIVALYTEGGVDINLVIASSAHGNVYSTPQPSRKRFADSPLSNPRGMKRRYPPGQTPTELKAKAKREAFQAKKEAAKKAKEEREAKAKEAKEAREAKAKEAKAKEAKAKEAKAAKEAKTKEAGQTREAEGSGKEKRNAEAAGLDAVTPEAEEPSQTTNAVEPTLVSQTDGTDEPTARDESAGVAEATVPSGDNALDHITASSGPPAEQAALESPTKMNRGRHPKKTKKNAAKVQEEQAMVPSGPLPNDQPSHVPTTVALETSWSLPPFDDPHGLSEVITTPLPNEHSPSPVVQEEPQNQQVLPPPGQTFHSEMPILEALQTQPNAAESIERSQVAERTVDSLQTETQSLKVHQQRSVPPAAEPRPVSGPGVYINPPGYEKEHNPLKKGRPRKAKLAIFKSERLKDLDWFEPTPPAVYPASVLKRSKKYSAMLNWDTRSRQDEKETRATPALEASRDETPEVGATALDRMTPGTPRSASGTPARRAITLTPSYRSPYISLGITQKAAAIARAEELAATGQEDTAHAGEDTMEIDGERDMERSIQEPTVSATHDEANMEIPSEQPPEVDAQPLDTSAAVAFEGEQSSEQTAAPVENMDVDRGEVAETDQTVPVASGVSTPAQDVSAAERKSRNTPKKRGVTRGGGGIFHIRTKMIMAMVEQCEGVFPAGNTEIWTAFVAEWEKEYQKRINPPDRYTVRNSVKHLVETQKLRKLAFSFKDNDGLIVTRHILTLPHLKATSPELQELRKKMIDAHPRPYFPPQYEEPTIKYKPPGYNFVTEENVEVERMFKSPLEVAIERRIEISRKKREERNVEIERKKAEKKSKDVERSAARIERMRAKLPGDRFPVPPRLQRLSRPQKGDEPSEHFAVVDQLTGATQGLIDFGTIDIRDEDDDDEESGDDEPIHAPAGLASFIRTLNLNIASEGGADLSVLPRFNPPPLPASQVEPETPREADMVPEPLVGERAALLKSSAAPLRFHNETPELVAMDPGFQFIHLGPHTYDKFYEWQRIGTLMDPDICFNSNTGTFSTEFSVWRNARLHLWVNPVNPDHQAEWERSMPYDLHDMTLSSSVGRRRRKQPVQMDSDYSRFDLDLLKVQAWEIRHEAELSQERTLTQPRFINHIMYGSQVDTQMVDLREGLLAPTPVTEETEPSTAVVRWNHAESIVYTLDRPPSNETMPAKTAARPKTNRKSIRTPKSKGTVVPNEGAYSLDSDVQRPSQAYKKRLMRPRTGIQSQSRECIITQEDTRRLLYAMVIVQNLCGGVGRGLNWGIISDVFYDHPSWDIVAFRNRASWLRNHYHTVIEKLSEDFQEAFLDAYERGEVPPIDYNDLDMYDWAWLADWAIENIELMVDNMLPNLPSFRKALDAKYIIEDSPSHIPSKDMLWRPFSITSQRADLTAMLPFNAPVTSSMPRKTAAEEAVDAEFERAKSWIRANIATPKDRYNAHVARDKLSELEEPLINRSLSTLLGDRILKHENKGRLVPGRNYDLSDNFHQAFKQPLDTRILSQAVAFKRALDAAFGLDMEEDCRFIVPPNAADGVVLAILNLVAYRRVKYTPLLPKVNNAPGAPFPRLSIWGFVEGSYQTMQMDKRHLVFPLELRPEPSYIYGNPLLSNHGFDPAAQLQLGGAIGLAGAGDILPEPPHPQAADPKANIPLWRDIHGFLIQPLWKKFVASVLQGLVMRPGCGAPQLVRQMKGVVCAWEVELCIEWLRGVGAVKSVAEVVFEGLGDGGSGKQNAIRKKDGAEKGGFVVAEGWWAVLWDFFDEGTEKLTVGF